MNRLGIIGDLIRNTLIFLAQIMLFKQMVLFESAFCFAYVIILLQLSLVTNPLLQMTYAFLIGLAVDLFYNTPGIHAAATVAMVFCRIYWINLLTPRGGYDTGAKVNLRSQGLRWFVIYSFPLIMIHTLVLFFVEAGGSRGFWSTIGFAINSSFFTLSIVLLMQYAFYKQVK